MNVGPSWARRLAFAAALLLVLAAVWAVWRQREGLESAAQTLRSGRWWLVGALAFLPLVNWILTGVMFWALMPPSTPGRTGITMTEMCLVIGTAWLANYLPARPGFFGRLAYHKTVNGVSFSRSMGAILGAIAIGGCCVVYVLLVAPVLARSTLAQGTVAAALAAPALLGLAAAVPCWRRGQWGRWCIAFAARHADVLVWMVRYWVAFSLVGRPLSLGESAAFAAISQAAALVPFVGNGLGIREWAIRWAAPAIPPWLAGPTGLSGPLALSADVMNRAAELVVAIPTGLLCGALLGARRRVSPAPAT